MFYSVLWYSSPTHCICQVSFFVFISSYNLNTLTVSSSLERLLPMGVQYSLSSGNFAIQTFLLVSAWPWVLEVPEQLVCQFLGWWSPKHVVMWIQTPDLSCMCMKLCRVYVPGLTANPFPAIVQVDGKLPCSLLRPMGAYFSIITSVSVAGCIFQRRMH